MAFVLELGGIDRSTYYMNGSFALRETLGSRSTADFVLFDAAGALSVEVGTEAKLTIDDVVVFSGSVQSTNTNFPSMNYSDTAMTMRVSCVDHNEVLDRKLVSRVYSYAEGITFGAIVRDLISEYLSDDGIVEGQIQNGKSTNLVTFNYETVNSILEKLSGAVGYVFYVDYNKALHFRDRINIEAPYEITSSAPNYRSLTVNQTRSQYRNRQYLRGGMQISPNSRSEVFAGDSVNRTFTVSQPIGAEPIIEVIREGGLPGEVAGRWNRQVVGLDGNNGNPEVQWTWKQNEREVTQDSEGEVLKTLYFGIPQEDADSLQEDRGWTLFPLTRSHDFVRITYRPLVRILARRDDEAQIASRAAVEGNSGLYESIEEDERVLDSKFAQERVRGMLSRFGNIPKVADISTDEPGIRAGQLQRIDLSKEGLADSRYLIESVSAKDRGDFTLTYTYKALDGESLGGWQQFFRKLLDRNKEAIMTEGEVVMMFNDPQASVTVSDALPTPATSNTLGSYTVDPYTVCLVNANSTVGGSFPSPLTYAETILQSSPTLYYRFDEIANRITTPFGTGVNVQDSSLTGNSGTSFNLLTGVSPGAVGEDPVDVFGEINQTPGRRPMVSRNFGRGRMPWNIDVGDVWDMPTIHAPGRFAPESNFPSICSRFPPPITAGAGALFPRVMVPSSVLDGEADTTIEFWVNAAQVTHEMNLVNAGNAATTLEEMRIVLEANASPSEPNQDTLTVRYYDQVAAAVREVSWPGQTIRTLNTLEAETPHVGYFVHIALVRNEAENLFELFINGNGVGIKVVNSIGDRISLTNMSVDANGLVIGQKFSGSLGAWDGATGYEGMLDEFAIFTKVLNDGEIADHSISKRKRYYMGTRIPATGQPTYMGL